MNIENICLILLTIILSLLGMQNRLFNYRMMLSPQAVLHGKIYQTITYGFVHANGAHLFANMFTLFFFGSVIADIYRYNFGLLSYTLFYLSALVVSAIPSIIKERNHSNYYGLGASGAVTAVLFVYIMMAPWQKIYFFGVLPIPAVIFGVIYIIFSVMQMRKDGPVNHLAHLTGALYAIAITSIAYPYVIPRFLRQITHPVF